MKPYTRSILALGVLAAGALALAGCSAGGNSAPAAASTPTVTATHPDFSGFWNLDMKVPRDPALMALVPANTVFMDDTGPV